MANKKLTDLTELTTPADNDFLYIVDVSDTTESAQGTSKKIRKDKVDSGASKENIENKQNNLTPDGTGTKYPTVDAVNTIDLQKVINVGGYAEVDGGSSYATILGGTAYDREVRLNIEDSVGNYSKLSIFNDSVEMEGSNEVSISGVVIEDGNLSISKQMKSLGSNSTSIYIEDPLATTTLNFPAKTVAGTYTLATTDETVNLTGNQTIYGEKTFADNVFLQSSTLLLNNSDKDGYGEISNILNRYLFVNQFEEIQFLMQNSGFVTYKSPTISGTFNNANLTESRTFTLPDVTGTIPIISQTITNGVTDKSPSEDAVFDALANVTRSFVIDNIPSTTVTGTLSETILKSYLMPANTFSSTGNFKVPEFLVVKGGTLGALNIRIYVNTSNTLTGAVQIARYTATSTNVYIKIRRSYNIYAGYIYGLGFTVTNMVNDITATSGTMDSTAYEVSNPYYIITTATLSNTGDSATQKSFEITN